MLTWQIRIEQAPYSFIFVINTPPLQKKSWRKVESEVENLCRIFVRNREKVRKEKKKKREK